MSFSTTLSRLSDKSSRKWLARQYRDPYVRGRLQNPNHYRSRSAFKLLDIDGKYHLFKHDDVKAVVDLGAAPGGWSQVIAGKLGWNQEDPSNYGRPTDVEVRRVIAKGTGYGLKAQKKQEVVGSWSSVVEPLIPVEDDVLDDMDDAAMDSTGPLALGRGVIIAVDLLPIVPIHGVTSLQMDFLSSAAADTISRLLETTNGKADIICCDMAANVTGNRMHDIQSSLDICTAVFEFATHHLRTGTSVPRQRAGVLVMKHFMDPILQEFRKKTLQPHFRDVYFMKPESSRSESSEGYWICRGFKGVQSDS